MSTSSSKPSSYDAFAQVDQLVSKPVLGSDGAASWQSFQKDRNNGKNVYRPSVAPKAPLKKVDKLGTGFTSWEEERQHESQVRKESGHAQVGDGYTTFKQKNVTAGEAARKNKLKRIEQRIRPDEKLYYIAASTFEGYKYDYIFTTRDSYGTGYFWDGMDSLKKIQNGDLTFDDDDDGVDKKDDEQHNNSKSSKKKKRLTSSTEEGQQQRENVGEDETTTTAKKKKRKKKDKGPIIVEDPNHPLEQVAAAIRRRQVEQYHMASHPSLPIGWEAAVDPTKKKTYYYCRSTGERSWDIPTTTTMTTTTATTMSAPLGGTDTTKAAVTANTMTTPTTPNSGNSTSTNSNLPDGWLSAIDPTSGRTYYYRANGTGEQTWVKPTETTTGATATTTTTTAVTTETTTTSNQSLPSDWESALDTDSGKTYYYHKKTGETRWDTPKA